MDLAHLERAWEDIREWFGDAGLARTLDNLAAPASDADLDALAQALGVELPPALRWLYKKHDGQRDVDVFPLFGPQSFLPLRMIRPIRAGMLRAYFGVTPSDAPASTIVDRKHVFDDRERPLAATELDARWIPFANVDGDHLAVHAGTGRVIEIYKGDLPAIRVVADNFDEFLGGYADDLWNDLYAVAGDPDEPGVEQEGLRALRAYAGRL